MLNMYTFIVCIKMKWKCKTLSVPDKALNHRQNTIWAATWQNQQCGCAPSEDSDQPGHPPSLIRVFAVRMKEACVLSYPLSAQRRLWSDWADAQADVSLRWAHRYFVGFVMSRLILVCGAQVLKQLATGLKECHSHHKLVAYLGNPRLTLIQSTAFKKT